MYRKFTVKEFKKYCIEQLIEIENKLKINNYGKQQVLELDLSQLSFILNIATVHMNDKLVDKYLKELYNLL